ncbi:glycosyltransferase [Blastococcus brunescens]|uniref:Glycosyltransferase n=1 Tax=Blastococcus brunescens TaxID=1564165 RepID=A0ABZ1B5L0_9ACTN|nr:glycosyltransferase [Blastococcus sp. BMG 8361]WRL66095.1 glycosyltransferase [Blastococcus sp. BMG 8361]
MLVFGGSQGAQTLNRAAVAAAAALTDAGVQVLHARGPKNTHVTVPERPAGSPPTCSSTIWNAWTSPTPPPTSPCAGPGR